MMALKKFYKDTLGLVKAWPPALAGWYARLAEGVEAAIAWNRRAALFLYPRIALFCKKHKSICGLQGLMLRFMERADEHFIRLTLDIGEILHLVITAIAAVAPGLFWRTYAKLIKAWQAALFYCGRGGPRLERGRILVWQTCIGLIEFGWLMAKIPFDDLKGPCASIYESIVGTLVKMWALGHALLQHLLLARALRLINYQRTISVIITFRKAGTTTARIFLTTRGRPELTGRYQLKSWAAYHHVPRIVLRYFWWLRLYRYNVRRARHFYWHWRQYTLTEYVIEPVCRRVQEAASFVALGIRYGWTFGHARSLLLYRPHKFFMARYPHLWATPAISFRLESPYLAYATRHRLGPHAYLPARYVARAGLAAVAYRLAVYGQFICIRLVWLSRPLQVAAWHLFMALGFKPYTRLLAYGGTQLAKSYKPSFEPTALYRGAATLDVPFFCALAAYRRARGRFRKRRRLYKFVLRVLWFLLKLLAFFSILGILLLTIARPLRPFRSFRRVFTQRPFLFYWAPPRQVMAAFWRKVSRQYVNMRLAWDWVYGGQGTLTSAYRPQTMAYVPRPRQLEPRSSFYWGGRYEQHSAPCLRPSRRALVLWHFIRDVCFRTDWMSKRAVEPVIGTRYGHPRWLYKLWKRRLRLHPINRAPFWSLVHSAPWQFWKFICLSPLQRFWNIYLHGGLNFVGTFWRLHVSPRLHKTWKLLVTTTGPRILNQRKLLLSLMWDNTGPRAQSHTSGVRQFAKQQWGLLRPSLTPLHLLKYCIYLGRFAVVSYRFKVVLLPALKKHCWLYCCPFLAWGGGWYPSFIDQTADPAFSIGAGQPLLRLGVRVLRAAHYLGVFCWQSFPHSLSYTERFRSQLCELHNAVLNSRPIWGAQQHTATGASYGFGGYWDTTQTANLVDFIDPVRPFLNALEQPRRLDWTDPYRHLTELWSPYHNVPPAPFFEKPLTAITDQLKTKLNGRGHFTFVDAPKPRYNAPLQNELQRGIEGASWSADQIFKTGIYPVTGPSTPPGYAESRKWVSWSKPPAQPPQVVVEYPSSDAYRGFYTWDARHDILHRNYFSKMYWPVSRRVVPAPRITSNRDVLRWVYKLPDDRKIDILRQPRPLEPWGLHEHPYIKLANNFMWEWDVKFPYAERYRGWYPKRRYKPRRLDITSGYYEYVPEVLPHRDWPRFPRSLWQRKYRPRSELKISRDRHPKTNEVYSPLQGYSECPPSVKHPLYKGDEAFYYFWDPLYYHAEKFVLPVRQRPLRLHKRDDLIHNQRFLHKLQKRRGGVTHCERHPSLEAYWTRSGTTGSPTNAWIPQANKASFPPAQGSHLLESLGWDTLNLFRIWGHNVFSLTYELLYAWGPGPQVAYLAMAFVALFGYLLKFFQWHFKRSTAFELLPSMGKDLKWNIHNPYATNPEKGPWAYWTSEPSAAGLWGPSALCLIDMLRKCYYWGRWWGNQPVPSQTIFNFGWSGLGSIGAGAVLYGRFPQLPYWPPHYVLHRFPKPWWPLYEIRRSLLDQGYTPTSIYTKLGVIWAWVYPNVPHKYFFKWYEIRPFEMTLQARPSPGSKILFNWGGQRWVPHKHINVWDAQNTRPKDSFDLSGGGDKTRTHMWVPVWIWRIIWPWTMWGWIKSFPVTVMWNWFHYHFNPVSQLWLSRVSYDDCFGHTCVKGDLAMEYWSPSRPFSGTPLLWLGFSWPAYTAAKELTWSSKAYLTFGEGSKNLLYPSSLDHRQITSGVFIFKFFKFLGAFWLPWTEYIRRYKPWHLVGESWDRGWWELTPHLNRSYGPEFFLSARVDAWYVFMRYAFPLVFPVAAFLNLVWVPEWKTCWWYWAAGDLWPFLVCCRADVEDSVAGPFYQKIVWYPWRRLYCYFYPYVLQSYEFFYDAKLPWPYKWWSSGWFNYLGRAYDYRDVYDDIYAYHSPLLDSPLSSLDRLYKFWSFIWYRPVI